MPDEPTSRPSVHDVLRGSLAHHAEQLGDPVADIDTVWQRVDHRRARRRRVAVAGSFVAIAAGAAGILLVANPTGSPAPLDDPDATAAQSWGCTGPLGSDGTYDYFQTCEALPYVVTPTAPSTIVGSMTPALTAPSISTVPPTTASSLLGPRAQIYVVVGGDSVYGIAERFVVDPEVLAAYNDWPEGISHNIDAGDQVLIPPTEHVVVLGDSLASIADRYGLGVDALVTVNGWPDGRDHVIRPEDVVLIPLTGIGGATDTLPPATTATISTPGFAAPSATITPACQSTMADVVVTVPCPTPTTAGAPVSSTVVTVSTIAGAYRCSGFRGQDTAYHYYDSCEAIGSASAILPQATSMVFVVTNPPGDDTSVPSPTTTSTSTVAPAATTAPPSAAFEKIYIVRAGDSIFRIAQRYGFEMEVLVNYNGWPEGIEHPLIVGEEVKIPPDARFVPPEVSTVTNPPPATTMPPG